MRITNLNKSLITKGWKVGKWSRKIPPHSEGLSAAFFVKAAFRIHSEGVATPWEKGPGHPSGDLMNGGDKRKGLGYSSDFVPYKPQAEFTAIGTAYPPENATTHFLATMRVGDCYRSIGVIGERIWQHGMMGEKSGTPQQVKATQLSWNNARGGPDYPPNPLGRGRDGKAMPLLEDPTHLLSSTSDVVCPAVLAPMPMDAPLRKAKVGTYNKDWIAKGWPWLPEDFDYSFFNAAHPSQWIKGYLKGDEELSFEHMHHQHPVYKCRLPGLRARCFVSVITNWRVGLSPAEEKREFREVALDLDTLWVDMDQEKLILVWRGRTPIRSMKLRDVEHLMICTEALGAPDLGLAHYESQLPVKKSRTKCMPDSTPTSQTSPDTTPSTSSPESVSAPSGISEPKDSPVPGMDLEAIHKNGLEKKDLKCADFSGLNLSKVNFRGANLSGARFVKSMLAGADLTGANLSGADLTHADLSSVILDKAEFKGAVTKGTIWKNCSLGGAKLSDLDLSGADFSGSKGLLGNFQNSRLVGANFSGVEFTHADFSGAALEKADFTKSKLQRCNFRGARAQGLRMDDAEIFNLKAVGADFTGGSFRRVSGTKTIWERAVLDKTDFLQAVLPKARFCEALFRDANLDRVDMPRVVFDDALLQKSKLTNANLLQAIFSRADLTQASLDGSNLYQAGFWETILLHASWKNAVIKRTRLDV